ncbi:Phosphoenolpyruvate carboxykinase [ATP] [Caloramator mitchellensis]|uniref:Phosphoenolpyruvate carboxykinase (ATP) n=1 Tax=Caloramator mitchellensis TaxID=908809 RepID=A0A0R3JYG1_CALMK|nr:phosphoenolpyruvate carboxykinase (ATP) [Caloramator mitchellensis]KRQ88106.1 Phosphoenolpyruvate carboxykinase [ATP] [Caloramator mitchellensis]
MSIKDFLQNVGISNTREIHHNLSAARLVEHALKRGEGQLTSTGALNIKTGKYTGRSPQDRFIVDYPEIHKSINWGKVNRPIDPEVFERIYARLTAYLQNKDLYVFDGFVGADRRYTHSIRFINELPAHNLFVRQLFIRPTEEELNKFIPQFTVISAPYFNAVPEIDNTNSEVFIILDFVKRIVIIGGTHYCGEMKKSIFTAMNYLLPQLNVLPMHCSANVGKDGDVALFFGLSGTGKTTLSADPNRMLIGDDEHGWSEDGVFNFEGGCYAKCINLSREKEPQIYDAIKFGTVLENVVLDDKGNPNYDDDSLTENTRAAYPIDYIPNAVLKGVGGHPKTILFLTADAFGVLPPISKLTKEQAMFHFISGYTSKLAGTERGITEPQATFSSCFGEPFMPMNPVLYAKMLGEKITKHNVNVYLVNTGWSGGPYGIGKRMNLKHTRAMVTAAISGDLENVKYIEHPIFKVLIPMECPNVPTDVLNPINTWSNKEDYNRYAKELANKFYENIKKFSGISDDILEAAPDLI